MPRSVLRISFARLVVELCCADIAVPGKLLDLFHFRTVLQGVSDGRFSEAMDANAAAPKPVRVNADG